MKIGYSAQYKKTKIMVILLTPLFFSQFVSSVTAKINQNNKKKVHVSSFFNWSTHSSTLAFVGIISWRNKDISVGYVYEEIF